MIAAVLSISALVGCSAERRTDAVAERQLGFDEATGQFQWRRPRERDEFPAVSDDSYPDVRIDRASALRADSGHSRYRLWLTRGERIGGGHWKDSFDAREVCLHLFDERLVLRGSQCAAMREADQPGRLLMVLSGGADGAPGLRPREVVVAGVALRGIDAVQVGAASRFVRARVKDSAFLVVTRIDVDAVEFRSGDALRGKVVVNACQRC